MEVAVAFEGGVSLKRQEEAGAFEGGDSLKRHEAAMVNLVGSLAIAVDDRGLKTKEAAKPWEVKGEILKMKNEITAAWYHWLRINPSAAVAAPPQKKGKTVVKKFLLPKELVDEMYTRPMVICEDLSDEFLNTDGLDFRPAYEAAKLLEAKSRAYWDVIHAQQEELGYAEDETEVTDDEEEEEVVVVKN